MNEKNKWIDDIIDSAGSLNKVEPRSVVFDNVLIELDSEKVQKMPISRITYSIVATFVIVSLNIFSILNYSSDINSPTNSDVELISNFNLYE